jgi:hypothetical protein
MGFEDKILGIMIESVDNKYKKLYTNFIYKNNCNFWKLLYIIKYLQLI